MNNNSEHNNIKASVWGNYFFSRPKTINSENIKVKREMYKKFVKLVLNLFSNKKDAKGQVIVPDIKDKLYEFYEDYSLYSSPDVINTFADFMQFSYKNTPGNNTKLILLKLAKVIKEMRKEVGLSNWGLGLNGERIFRAMFKDYDNLK
jgi:hypothetical protein